MSNIRDEFVVNHGYHAEQSADGPGRVISPDQLSHAQSALDIAMSRAFGSVDGWVAQSTRAPFVLGLLIR